MLLKTQPDTMQIDILTIFPKIFNSYLNESIIKKAIRSKLLKINIHDIRKYADNKHKKVDDRPYGGGAGMVMTPQPIYDAIKEIKKNNSGPVFYLSPKGKMLSNSMSQKISKIKSMILLCGRYEGIDQRIIELCVDKEISIGKYILTGGELPAMVLMDTVCRFIPGVLGDGNSAHEESFSKCLKGKKEYPHYTKPRVFKKKTVPNVLLSGNHAKIKEWRINRTKK